MKKKFIANDLKKLDNEFYSNYNPDYWLCKISLLKNCHDNFDKVKAFLKKDLNEIPDADYNRVLRTEMHFLYFQMIETLFEIIFAIFKYGHKNIWFNLTNSNWKKNYDEIKDLNENSDLFTRKITVSSGENKRDLLLIKWIFYFVYSPNKTDLEWEINFNKIKEFLLIFAGDFSDRNEYNAFKHAMRFYNSPFSAYFGFQGMKDMQMICKSNDSITYLEEKMIEEIKTKNKPVYGIYITTKPFYFDIDFNCCKIIYSMIKNIIDSRKHYLLPNLFKEKLNLIIYNDFDIDKDYLPESSLTKQSFPV